MSKKIGYHLHDIQKGDLGERSKIVEEVRLVNDCFNYKWKGKVYEKEG